MLRTVLVGSTKTLPAKLREINGVASATMYPTYVKGTGDSDYNLIRNKPSVNGVTLEGNLTLEDLGILEAQPPDIDSLFQGK